MSRRYLLDGYNIVHQMPELDHLNVDEQRNGLIAFIGQRCPQGSLKNEMWIVFDGKPGSNRPRCLPSVHVIFSYDESADERIKKEVGKARNKKEIFVVTDDRDIQFSVRSQGAKIISVKQFLKAGKRPEKSNTRPSSVKEISEQTEKQITGEMKEIWIKKK